MSEKIDAALNYMEEVRFLKRYSEQIKIWTGKYHFNAMELQCLLLIYYKLAKKERPHKNPVRLQKKSFRDLLFRALDMTDDLFMDRILLILDQSSGLYVEMESWIAAFSLFLRGTLEEKIEFCFKVYDYLGKGVLAKDHLIDLLKYSLKDLTTHDDEAENNAKDIFEIINQKFDVDRDGKITLDDFKKVIMKNPMYLEAFGECLPSHSATTGFLSVFTKDYDSYYSLLPKKD